MSRLFDGTDDQMVYGSLPAVGSGPNMAFGSALVVVKIAAGDGTWQSFMERENSGGTGHFAFGRHSNNNIYNANQTAASNGGASITDADGWMVVATTKATGSAAPTLYKIPIGGSTTSGAGDTSLANYSDSASGNLRLGGNDDFANIYLAVAAVFASDVLTQAEIETIASTKTTQSVIDAGATWCVDDSDAFATDLVGSVDRTSITGTTDDADDPSGWVYGLGGAAAADPFPYVGAGYYPSEG